MSRSPRAIAQLVAASVPTLAHAFAAQGSHSPAAGRHALPHDLVGPYAAALRQTSPASGESGVSLTRETILRFDQPLDPTSAFTGAVSVTSVGQDLPFNARVSADRMSLTLFYVQPLPEARRVRVSIDGDLLLDSYGRLVDADADGVPGGARAFEFETTSITPFPGTRVIGRVFASELAPGGGSINVPLQGVRVSVDGAESTLFALTNANGDFTLDPAPAGRIFVHIDGRTATNPVPPGGYYPSVGKAWETRPDEELNVGDAFLPLVPAGTLQNVSTTNDTTLTFATAVLAAHPELAGTQITVRAASLFHDDGTPGAQVGIAPVPPDRLPGPLPAGLDFPIVITVQTDGAENFDAPAPVRFPNLPLPSTGQPLPAGSEAVLWSFNHDAGAWEAVAPARVDATGMYVETTVGGVLAPGWHGITPGIGTRGNGAKSCYDDCQQQYLSTLVDCAVSAVPGLGCVAGGIVNCAQTYRDCALAGVAGDGWACVKSITTNLGGVAIGCLPNATPGIGFVFGCGSALIDAFQTCDCLFGTTGLQMSSSPYTDQLALMERYQDFLAIYYGSPIWTNCVDPTANDPLTEWNRYHALQDQIYVVTRPTSPSGSIVDPAERASVLALPRPVLLQATDVAALIDYANSTSTHWSQGLFTHAQAGHGGFMDRDQALIAVDALALAAAAVAQHSPNLDPWGASNDFAEHLVARLSDPNEPVIPTSHVRYALVNETRGTVERGTLGGGGAIGAVAVNPDDYYRLHLVDDRTLSYGRRGFVPRAFARRVRVRGDGGIPTGVNAEVPRLGLQREGTDTDGDGLTDDAEFVVATSPVQADSDGDGIGDGAELLQGLNPTSNTVVATGIIATAPTAATAVDIEAFGDLAVVSRGSAGVSAFNVFNAMPPVLVAQIDTPGDAREADLSERFIAVADGPAGLAVIDADDLAPASILHQVPPSALGGSAAQCVAVAGGIAFVGTGAGHLAAVELATGGVIDVVDLGSSVHDLAIEGERLFAVTNEQLRELRVFDVPLAPLGSAPLQGVAPTFTGRRRVFVGGGTAYVTHARGFQTFDVGTRGVLLLLGGGDTGQLGWAQIVANGARIGVAAVGPNFGDELHDLALYDITDPTQTNVFISSFSTPGIARAVSIYGGLAHVADSSSGMQVVNYRGYDALGQPPTVALSATPDQTQYTERSTILVRALASDDVQVRTVELLLDGRKVQADGNFPFQFFLELPAHVALGSNTHTLQLRAADTGGNAALTPLRSFDVVVDATPPRTLNTFPLAGVTVPPGFFDTFAFSVLASEGLDAAPLASAVELRSAGPDLALDTSDDVFVPFQATLAAADRRVVVRTTAPVGTGDLRLRLRANLLRDRNANPYDGDGDGSGGDDFTLGVHVTNDVTVFWDGGGDGVSWHDAQNWSANALPGPGDRVLVDAPLVSVAHSSGSTSVARLTARSRIALSGGTLTVSESSSIAGLSLSGSGVLAGAGDLTLQGTSTWSAGRIEGAGRLILASGATLTTFGNAPERQRALENHGAVVLGGNFIGPQFDNASDGLLRIAGNCSMSGTPFDNDGVVRVESGVLRMRSTSWTNDASIYVDAGEFIFDGGGTSNMTNAGLIRVARGALVRNIGSVVASTGTIQGGGGLSLQNGTTTVDGPLSISGAFTHSGGTSSFAAGRFLVTGPVTISAGDITIRDSLVASSFTGIGSAHATFHAPQTLASMSFAGGGTLDGTGNVTITGALDSSGGAGGAASGTGTLILAHGATFTCSALTVFDRPFECHGVTQVSASEWRGSGQRTIASDGVLVLSGGNLGGALLTNQGAWTSVTGAQVRVGSLQQMSTLAVQAGELDLAGGGFSSFTNSGTITVAAGATLRNSGNTLVSTGPIQAAGNVLLTNNSNSQFQGPVTCEQLLRVSGGSHSFSVGAFQASGAVEILGGQITIRDTIAASSFAGPNSAHAIFHAPQSFASFTLNNGILDGTGDVTITGAMTWDSAEVRSGGRLIVAPGAALTIGTGATMPLQRVVENHGTVTQAATVGRVQIDSAGGIDNAADGVLEIQAESDITGNGTITNAGSFRHTGGGTSQLFAGSVTNTGRIECLAGTLRFELPWTNAGVLSAAAGAVLRNQQSLALAPSSTLSIGIASTTSFGTCIVNGMLAYDGLLDLAVAGTYTPVVNDAFAIVTHGSRTGTFASVQGDQLGGGLVLVPTYSGTALTLTVQ